MQINFEKESRVLNHFFFFKKITLLDKFIFLAEKKISLPVVGASIKRLCMKVSVKLFVQKVAPVNLSGEIVQHST